MCTLLDQTPQNAHELNVGRLPCSPSHLMASAHAATELLGRAQAHGAFACHGLLLVLMRPISDPCESQMRRRRHGHSRRWPAAVQVRVLLLLIAF